MMNYLENHDKAIYSIGSVARMLDISVHTIRLYEKEGLILSFRKVTNHRLFSMNDIERLKCIRTAISEMKFSIPSIKTIYSLIPCWQIKGCSIQERNECPAYFSHTEPCWNFKHKDNICEVSECRDCDVYNNNSECGKIKNGIKNLLEIK